MAWALQALIMFFPGLKQSQQETSEAELNLLHSLVYCGWELEVRPSSSLILIQLSFAFPKLAAVYSVSVRGPVSSTAIIKSVLASRAY